VDAKAEKIGIAKIERERSKRRKKEKKNNTDK